MEYATAFFIYKGTVRQTQFNNSTFNINQANQGILFYLKEVGKR